jgi:hypothetical protein
VEDDPLLDLICCAGIRCTGSLQLPFCIA